MAEPAIVQTPEGFAVNGAGPDLKQVLPQHITDTDPRARRSIDRLRELGHDANGGKSFVDELAAKASGLMNAFRGESDRQKMGLIECFALEHREVGVRESTKAWAATR